MCRWKEIDSLRKVITYPWSIRSLAARLELIADEPEDIQADVENHVASSLTYEVSTKAFIAKILILDKREPKCASQFPEDPTQAHDHGAHGFRPLEGVRHRL